MKASIDLFHRAGRPTLRERRRWARSIEKLVADAHRYILLRAYRPLYNIDAVRRAAPALLEIAAALRDAELDVSRELLGDLRALLTDAGTSPLYRDHPIAALWAVEELRRRLLPTPARLRRAA